ncbi:hypothetical protein J5U18_11360 [Sphingobacteriaceae bacterium WQ 2009]|uniref:Tetratricopeptide repeat-containing protein n=1 Tax=Rhinopithecimicrobium faecis TaxID=2820698 RepID=A0A8T4HAU8_9SPHI|nr:hypothetical protein [Sphingobacteriaceae bacterium WQ 2009]
MRVLVTSFLFTLGSLTVVAQSNIKEGNNSFALYTKKGEFKYLESARKFADAAYVTKKDSAGTNNNLLRGLVYSSLAYADSLRKQKYPRDPIDISLAALVKLNKKGAISNYPNEEAYIKRNVANALVFKANAALLKDDFQAAYKNYKLVDSLEVMIDSSDTKNSRLTYNLAVLATKSNLHEEAIAYYKELLSAPKNTAEQAIELANIYLKQDNKEEALHVLETAKIQFPAHKELLFQLVGLYNVLGNYSKLTGIIEDAIQLEPENVYLNYLAGYAFENLKNIPKAIKYYKQVTVLDAKSFKPNLALGLIYLEEFLKNKSDDAIRDLAQSYLLKSNEIDPSDINTLKSLAIYYKETDDLFQLDRVNILLNQHSNN